MFATHGGDVLEISKKYKINAINIIDFSNNLNPLGASAALFTKLTKKIADIKFFPEIYSLNLCETAAEKYNLKIENFVFGNGSSQLIYIFFNNLVNIKSKVLLTVPNYSDYYYLIKKTGNRVGFLNLLNCFHTSWKIYETLNAELSTAHFDYAVVCNPNNPLGCFIEYRHLSNLIRKFKRTIFIIDESYFEFVDSRQRTADNSALGLLNGNSNIIIFKSLTKILATPGLRIGFAAGHKDLILKMRGFLPPWSVNPLSAEAAKYYFTNPERLRKSVDTFICAEKTRITDSFRKIKQLKIINSRCNFMTIKIQSSKIDALMLRDLLLRKHKILIRDCSNIFGLSEKYFRISIKKKTENDLLINALFDIFL